MRLGTGSVNPEGSSWGWVQPPQLLTLPRMFSSNYPELRCPNLTSIPFAGLRGSLHKH